MKKYFVFALILCLMLSVLATLAYAEEYYDTGLPRVVDEAELLTSEEELELEEKLLALKGDNNYDFVVLTVDSTGAQAVKHFAADYYDYGGYGVGEERSGVMLILVMDTRDWYILTTGDCIELFSDNDIENIGEDIVYYISDGYYAEGFGEFVRHCDGVINGYPYTASNAVIGILISLAIGLVIAFIATGAMKSKLTTVREAYAAADYLKRDSVYLRDSRDTFLYTTVTKRKKPEPQKSSGSSTFSGSSGSSHGGGGGKF